MLVVSNIDLPIKTQIIRPSAFLKSSIKDFTLNLSNDYRYLKTGYYVSMHAEVLGNRVLPTSGNIIDTNRTPILLLKAAKAGIPVSPFVVTDSVKQIIHEIGFPTVIFAVNPFSYDGYRIAKNRSGLYRALKSLGMNYKFAVCAEPLRSEITSLKSVFGKTRLGGRLAEIAERVYDAFGIPICKLHVQLVNEEAFLCSLQPLKTDEISPSDIDVMNEKIFEMSESERLVG